AGGGATGDASSISTGCASATIAEDHDSAGGDARSASVDARGLSLIEIAFQPNAVAISAAAVTMRCMLSRTRSQRERRRNNRCLDLSILDALRIAPNVTGGAPASSARSVHSAQSCARGE